MCREKASSEAAEGDGAEGARGVYTAIGDRSILVASSDIWACRSRSPRATEEAAMSEQNKRWAKALFGYYESGGREDGPLKGSYLMTPEGRWAESVPDFANDPAYLWPATVELTDAGYEFQKHPIKKNLYLWGGRGGGITIGEDGRCANEHAHAGTCTLLALEAKRAADAQRRKP